MKFSGITFEPTKTTFKITNKITGKARLNIVQSGSLKVSFKFFFSKGKCDPCQPGFGSVLLKALLDNMSFLPAAATGGM